MIEHLSSDLVSHYLQEAGDPIVHARLLPATQINQL